MYQPCLSFRHDSVTLKSFHITYESMSQPLAASFVFSSCYKDGTGNLHKLTALIYAANSCVEQLQAHECVKQLGCLTSKSEKVCSILSLIPSHLHAMEHFIGTGVYLQGVQHTRETFDTTAQSYIF